MLPLGLGWETRTPLLERAFEALYTSTLAVEEALVDVDEPGSMALMTEGFFLGAGVGLSGSGVRLGVGTRAVHSLGVSSGSLLLYVLRCLVGGVAGLEA